MGGKKSKPKRVQPEKVGEAKDACETAFRQYASEDGFIDVSDKEKLRKRVANPLVLEILCCGSFSQKETGKIDMESFRKVHDLFTGKTGTFEERLGFIFKFIRSSASKEAAILSKSALETFLKDFNTGFGKSAGNDEWEHDEIDLPSFVEYVASNKRRRRFVGELIVKK